MTIKSSQLLLAGIAALLTLGAMSVANSLDARPVVGYSLKECPPEIGFDYDQPLPQQSVALGVRNGGGTDASLVLHFYGENITISKETVNDHNRINSTNVYVYLYVPKNTNEVYYREKVYFTINDKVDSFSYSYEVTKNADGTVSGRINEFFGEITPFTPTHCFYIRQSKNKFVNS